MNFDFELVGKVGSMALISKQDNDIDYNIFARISRSLKPGCIWVTSGATEIGRLDYIKRNGAEIDEPIELAKIDYSAQGQSILMENYRKFINPNYSTRQVLVEHRHFNIPSCRKHLFEMLIRCPSQKAIPIINYNDAVSDEEILKTELTELKDSGKKVVECVDNDETAAQIACLVKAKRLIILSNIDGIYQVPTDKSSLIEEISGKDISEVIDNISNTQKLCSGASRALAGGAKAKLEYIKDAVRNGTTVYIANSKYRIEDIISGDAPRTIIGVR
ncbi:MAG: uridylate kinase [Clostridia bacterium]